MPTFRALARLTKHCAASRPPGVVLSAALIAYTNQPAAAVLDPETRYVRVDGASVGTGAELIAQTPLTGIWLTESGVPRERSVWTGQPDLRSTGTAASTCNDWTATAGTSPIGSSAGTDQIYWNFFSVTSACSEPSLHLYCVER